MRMTKDASLMIVADEHLDDARRQEIERLMQLFGEQSISDLSSPRWILQVTQLGLELRDISGQFKPLTIDFDYIPGLQHAHKPLLQALGRKTRTVIDATAGFGRDSFLIAALGYEMTAIERQPVIAVLLEDGLRRAKQMRPSIVIKLLQGDARQLLPTFDNKPDAIYLDPMFPEKRKGSALAKKSARILRAFAGNDEDKDELFAIAVKTAGKRVVVKQPHYATPLGGKPDESFRSKLVRYDIYLIK